MSALGKIVDYQPASLSVIGGRVHADQFIRGISHSVLSEDSTVISKPVEESRSTAEKLFDNRAELKTITAQYGLSYLDSKLRKQLFDQIDWILDVDEWEALDSYADQESFKTLMKFVLNAKPAQAPYLNIADDGHLVATWKAGDNKFRLECYANDRTNWFLSCTLDGEEEKLGGEARSLQRLIDRISPFKAAGWFHY